MQGYCGGSLRFSGQIRSMQRPEVKKVKRSVAAVATELERQRTARGGRRPKKENEKDLSRTYL